jgi:hypothetical protein
MITALLMISKIFILYKARDMPSLSDFNNILFCKGESEIIGKQVVI